MHLKWKNILKDLKMSKSFIDEYISSVRELNGTQMLAFLFAHNMCIGRKDVYKIWDSVISTIEKTKEINKLQKEDEMALGSMILSRIFIMELKKRGVYLISVNESNSDDFDKIYRYCVDNCGQPWARDPYEIIERLRAGEQNNQEHRER